MGFVDPQIMLGRYWSISVAGMVLPPEMMALCSSVQIHESMYSDDDDGQIVFRNTPNDILNNGEPLESLIDLRDSNKKNYVFEIGRPISITMGYGENILAETWPMTLARPVESYPEGVPTLTLKLKDQAFHCQWAKTGVIPEYITKLSEALIPVAQHYKFGYYIDDVVFDDPLHVPQGKWNDMQMLTRLVKPYNRTLKIFKDVIWVVSPYTKFNNTPDDYRFQLYYRCGDCSIRTVQITEKSRTGGHGMQGRDTGKKPKVIAGIDLLNGQSFVVENEDQQLQVSGDPEWIAELHGLTDARGVLNDKEVADEIKERSGIGGSQETAEVIFFTNATGGAFVSNMETTIFPTLTGETPPEVVDTSTKNPVDAGAKMPVGTDRYDASIQVVCFDPALVLGTTVKLFGLGHKNDGIYRIVGRTISMADRTPLSLTLEVKRGAAPGPNAKQDDKQADDGKKVDTSKGVDAEGACTLYFRPETNEALSTSPRLNLKKVVGPSEGDSSKTVGASVLNSIVARYMPESIAPAPQESAEALSTPAEGSDVATTTYWNSKLTPPTKGK